MQAVAVEPKVAFAQAEWDALDKKQRGAYILAALHHKRVSKSELAAQLYVSFQAVNAWAMGDSSADWARWMAVCFALGLKQTWKPSDAAFDRARAEIAKQIEQREREATPGDHEKRRAARKRKPDA